MKDFILCKTSTVYYLSINEKYNHGNFQLQMNHEKVVTMLNIIILFWNLLQFENVS